MKLGIAGGLTRRFIASPLTPLFLIAAFAFGLVALFSLPREEEPQISVPMVDIHVRADGLKAEDAVKLVTEPLETIVKSIDGVEHVYSETQDDSALVTARFKVGTNADTAILRVHEKIRANLDRIPVGIPEPLIVGRGIDDVAIVVVTLTPTAAASARWTENGLTRLARELQVEIAKLPDIGLTYIVGQQPEEIQVEPDPEKLSLYGVTLQQLSAKVEGANTSFQAGLIRDDGEQRVLLGGQTLQTLSEIGNLLVTARDGRPVYVRDVANVVLATDPSETRVDAIEKTGSGLQRAPAVSLAIAKRPGTNAVVIAKDIIKRLDAVRGQIVPADVQMMVTRNYGETANEKANELLFHLGLATVSIVILVAVAIGWREAVVVAVVIPTTILLTLFASWLMGYTLNRVSLFALIFSIGILVDDAIVVIENIARHWAMRDGRSRAEAAINAVAEVGNPTIVATLTVVAALLPMLFVSGMMGPYMSPIPANASAAMLFSFFVAVILTPWLMLRVSRKDGAAAAPHAHAVGLARARLYCRRPPHSSIAATRLDLPDPRRHRDACVALALLYEERRGEAFAVRQQVGAAGRRRPQGGLCRRGHRPRAADDRRSARADSGDRLVRDLCRHGGAVRLQRPCPPLLSALKPRTGRRADQPDAEGRASPRELRDRARNPPEDRRPRTSRRHDAESGRAAARSAGDLDAACRNLRSRRGDTKGSRRQGRTNLQAHSVHRRRRRFPTARRRRASGSASTRTISNITRSSRATCTTRSTRSSRARPSAIRIAAADGSRSRS